MAASMARRLASFAAALLVGGAAAQSCRMDPGATHSACGLPSTLSNFQGNHACAREVKVGRPASLAEAQALVRAYAKVKASGVGHSWNADLFCAGDDAAAINLVMTELKPTLDFILRPPAPTLTPPPGFPIVVDEERRTVTVAAGVPQRMLLDYLAEYRMGKQPDGWSLPAYSWFVDQTIGGAVATGTHGSSMRWGSLSSQVRGFQMLLANGSLLELNDPAENLHLWRAASVSVGRLGVLTRLTMRIVPQQAIRRSLAEMDFGKFAEQVKAVGREYAAARVAGDVDGQKRALSQLDETQAFWHVPTGDIWRTDYEHLDKEPLSVLLNTGGSAAPAVQAMSGPDGAFDQGAHKALAQNGMMTRNTRFWANFFRTSTRGFATPGTYETRKAYLSMTEAGNSAYATFAPYDQYEVAVPIETAGACLVELGREVYGPDNLWDGFRSPALLRFTTAEDAYLSPTNGGPRMWANLEDFLTPSGEKNWRFQKVVEIMMTRCSGRLHWSKAGWGEHNKCFDGAAQYPATWCDFGCAAEQLDPARKFDSGSDVWRWRATRGGAEVPFASCCTPAGFSPACKCASAAAC